MTFRRQLRTPLNKLKVRPDLAVRVHTGNDLLAINRDSMARSQATAKTCTDLLMWNTRSVMVMLERFLKISLIKITYLISLTGPWDGIGPMYPRYAKSSYEATKCFLITVSIFGLFSFSFPSPPSSSLLA